MCSAPGHTWVPAALGMWLKITPKKRWTFLGLKPSGWQWAFSPCAPARASKKPRARGPAGTAPPHLPSGWILSPTALLHTQLIALRGPAGHCSHWPSLPSVCAHIGAWEGSKGCQAPDTPHSPCSGIYRKSGTLLCFQHPSSSNS